MIVPGEVTHVTYTFSRPGEYLVLCHEYCGLGHQQMYTKVIVA
jgi:cytochrome c oxidase subunit 2